MNQHTILRIFGRESKVVAVASTAMAIGVLAFLLVALAAESAAGAGTCAGKNVYPGDDLAAIADNHGPGTTFCIKQGMYNVSRPVTVQSGDNFVGMYSDYPRPTITTEVASVIMKAEGSTGARIEGLRISRARATKSCQPLCGRGISGGTDLTLIDVRATLNENQGVGGSGPGLEVISSEIDQNGFGDNGAYYAQDGRESAAGIKSVNSFKVINSYIHDNAWTGVWCDLECGAFEVRDSRLVRNGRAAIHDEISTGAALFVNNRIQDNGHAPYVWGRYGGILVVSSQNAEAYGNAFGNNRRYGVDTHEDSRNPTVDNVSVHDNQLNGDALAGCDLQGVSCTSPPKVDSVVPAEGATGVAPGVNVAATFSEDMLASSVNGNTFKLFKKGSTTKIAATVSYDAATHTAKLNPTNSLRRGGTYEAVVTTRAKDLAGNPLAQQKNWIFKVST